MFERTPEASAAVAAAAWKESQYWTWATGEVVLSPGDAPIRWHERSERDERTRRFGGVLADLRTELDGLPPIE